MKAVIDTNVLLVANGDHGEVSPDCQVWCVKRLLAIQSGGKAVIDGDFIILGEYLNKTRQNPPKGVGDVFLKWLLREANNLAHVEQVKLTPKSGGSFDEFPDAELESEFDPADRVFAAVANAHHGKPPVWQATDSKWLDWWLRLAQHGVRVDFLCPADTRRFYSKKFPARPVPDLPG